MPYSVNAVLAAGGPLKTGLRLKTGQSYEALVEFGGLTSLESVVSCLRASQRVERVLVTAPDEVQRRLTHLEVEWLPDQGRGGANLLAGLYELPPDQPCLMGVCDLPFAARANIEDFLDQCDPGLDFNYGVTEREEMERFFPAYPRRYVPVREGRYTGSGFGMVRPGLILKRVDHFNALFGSRKNTLKIALQFGPGFLLGRILGTLSLFRLEQKFSQIFEVESRVVLKTHPALTLDVDDESDYDYALSWMAKQKQKSPTV